MSERQRSQGFKFALKFASVVPGCRGHQHTIMACVRDVINTYIIQVVHPTFLCAIPPLPSSFRNTGGPRLLQRNCKISPNKRYFVAYDK